MIRMMLPLIVFLGLIGLLLAGLDTAHQRQIIDSPLIGKPVPAFSLPTLHEADRVATNDDLAGKPYVLNVWGSWCPSCRIEHPLITRLGEEIDVPLVGVNWKDERPSALRWLDQFGDAWDFHIVDQPGDFVIDLGVYGAPETFLVDHNGIIRHKHTGPVTTDTYAGLVDRIRKLEQEAKG
ncbi:MAG: DsbE family thiol:disulfide interchange protein [Wenzhouxiangellaceae bacterium]|nr:DsbE family thiol:disulfide interchange protein [Wenzhouxiangellaceae bacterium]